MSAPAILTFGSPRRRLARVPLLFRARDCEDEDGIFALSYGKRVGLVHARAGAGGVAAARDSNGNYQWLPASTPRISTERTTAGDLVRTLLMEPASGNVCLRAQDLAHSVWQDNGAAATVTAGAVRGPDGKMSGHLVVGQLSQGVAFTADGTKVFYWVLKQFDAANSTLQCFDTDGGPLQSMRAAWAAGVPTLSMLFGAGVPFSPWHLRHGWYLLACTAPAVVAANDNQIVLYSDYDGSTVGGGGVYAWHAQAENALAPSSPIRSAAAALSRAADSAYFPFALTPRALTAYIRQVNVGAFLNTGVTRRFFRLGPSSPTSDSYFEMVGSSADLAVGVLHNNGAGGTVSDFIGGAVVSPLGAVVESLGLLGDTGSVTAVKAVDGGAPLGASSPSAGQAMPGAWSQLRAYVAGFSSGATAAAYTDLVIAEGALPMDECRELCEVG